MTATLACLRTLTHARTTFQAARRLHRQPHGHPSARLHGHGFQADVQAALPPGWAAYAGDEAQALQRALQAAAAPLCHADLNAVDGGPAEPGDADLAAWLLARLQAAGVPGIVSVGVASTDTQGARVRPGAAVQLWRRYRFQSAHRLPHVPLGHKCGRLHGHGFEAIVAVDAPAAGAAPSHDHLDAVWAPLHAALNYRCLNDIDGLHNPTSENLSSWLWQQLLPALPDLDRVTVYETASCGAAFVGAGGGGGQHRIWKDFTLDSAVALPQAPVGSDAAAVHGHTYTLRLQLQAPLDALLGWAVDFGDVKALFDPVFKALDHRPLHELPALQGSALDCAAIAQAVWAEARAVLPQLVAVELYETPGCGNSVEADAP